MKPIEIVRDDEKDIVTIEGIRYSQEILRQLGTILPVGEPFKIVRREDGVLELIRVECR